MKRRLQTAAGLLWIVGLLLFASWAGCNASSPSSGTASEADKIKAALAKLSPEDAAAAAKQAVCPVGKHPLGSMGPPEKVDVNGQPVWICCAGCREELLANADKYLAALKK